MRVAKWIFVYYDSPEERDLEMAKAKDNGLDVIKADHEASKRKIYGFKYDIDY